MKSTYITELAWLQVADCMTTGLFLAKGLQEANPLVATVISISGMAGLVVLKCSAMVLALLWGVYGRAVGPYVATVWFFRAVVVWNLFCLWGR